MFSLLIRLEKEEKRKKDAMISKVAPSFMAKMCFSEESFSDVIPYSHYESEISFIGLKKWMISPPVLFYKSLRWHRLRIIKLKTTSFWSYMPFAFSPKVVLMSLEHIVSLPASSYFRLLVVCIFFAASLSPLHLDPLPPSFPQTDGKKTRKKKKKKKRER